MNWPPPVDFDPGHDRDHDHDPAGAGRGLMDRRGYLWHRVIKVVG